MNKVHNALALNLSQDITTLNELLKLFTVSAQRTADALERHEQSIMKHMERAVAAWHRAHGVETEPTPSQLFDWLLAGKEEVHGDEQRSNEAQVATAPKDT